MPSPTSFSFPYAHAVSIWRYPAAMASMTACVAAAPLMSHVPNPIFGMLVPSAKGNVSFRIMIVAPFRSCLSATDCTPPRGKLPMLILIDISMPFEYAIGRLELPIPSIYGIIAAKRGFILFVFAGHISDYFRRRSFPIEERKRFINGTGHRARQDAARRMV